MNPLAGCSRDRQKDLEALADWVILMLNFHDNVAGLNVDEPFGSKKPYDDILNIIGLKKSGPDFSRAETDYAWSLYISLGTHIRERWELLKQIPEYTPPQKSDEDNSMAWSPSQAKI